MFDTLWLWTAEGRYAFFVEGRVWQVGRVPTDGAVYRARVERLTPALGGAFVTLGETKALLRTDRTYAVGDVVIVQVAEPAKGDKLAVVHDHPCLVGRYVLYLPGGNTVRVSRRLPVAERETLKEKLALPAGGWVIRYAAGEAEPDAVRAEAAALVAEWAELPPNVGYLYTPKPDYTALVAAADTLVCDSPTLCDAQPKGKVTYNPAIGARWAETEEPLARKVQTQDGVELVFDTTCAATVVDVDSGRYLPAGDHVTVAEQVNLVAARELVRQLLLRDVTGMILVDFVSTPVDRAKRLLQRLQALAAAYDPRLHVVDVTRLGIVELTRAHAAKSSVLS